MKAKAEMFRTGPANLYVLVWGDWATICKAKKYADRIWQTPDADEEAEHYLPYRVPVDDMDDLLEAMAAFRQRGLTVAVSMEFVSEDGMVHATITANGSDTGGGAVGAVRVDLREDDFRRTVQDAANLLLAALK